MSLGFSTVRERKIVTGGATRQGCQAFFKAHSVHQGRKRICHGLEVSCIGMGTYLGEGDREIDELYKESLRGAMELGCNFMDSAVNYRYQQSERVIGETLSELFKKKNLTREQVVVCTKGGFVPFDRTPPPDLKRYLFDRFIDKKIAPAESFVEGIHCLYPSYIQNQIDQSLKNLRLGSIDIYYLHNPEFQLRQISRSEFEARIRSAFEVLEKNVAEGKIQRYGTATWDGYRVTQNSKEYLSLSRLCEIAQQVGGMGHHFNTIQLPYNLAMPEAFLFQNQTLDGQLTSIINAASELGIRVVVSASLLQAQLCGRLPEALRGKIPGTTDAQKALEFVTSTPGVSVALVGMKSIAHVHENLELLRQAPITDAEFSKLFQKAY